jgi:hypothetical protein
VGFANGAVWQPELIHGYVGQLVKGDVFLVSLSSEHDSVVLKWILLHLDARLFEKKEDVVRHAWKVTALTNHFTVTALTDHFTVTALTDHFTVTALKYHFIVMHS